MVACGMTGLAAGYAIGIVGDAVGLPLCPQQS
jgi:F0F1-type ATP synthase membrane subunit c/vacuolar-type H+-ATPase subunit K